MRVNCEENAIGKSETQVSFEFGPLSIMLFYGTMIMRSTMNDLINCRRRNFFKISFVSFALSACLLGSEAPSRAQGTSVPVEKLMMPEALPDIPQGKEDAPVTIVEYASMTCSHCAAFYAATYPVLKSKYIDTGKVRFILREFPLDPLASAGFMLARCEGPDKRNAMVDLLFAQQKNWAFTEKPIEALENLVKQTGMSKESFESCLKDQNLYDKIKEVQDRAAKEFGVNATPTFFINGKKQNGEILPDDLEKMLEPLLKG